MVEDLISSLRRIAKVSYGATIEEARMVSKTQRDAAELIEQQAARIAALESERATLLHDVEIHARDARRYRWLRAKFDGNDAELSFLRDDLPYGCNRIFVDRELNIAIDAALANQKQAG
jgi:hypothetical protein